MYVYLIGPLTVSSMCSKLRGKLNILYSGYIIKSKSRDFPIFIFLEIVGFIIHNNFKAFWAFMQSLRLWYDD